MSNVLPVVYLARHGETAWTISRQHTGVTDLPLTAQGEAEAVRLGERLKGVTFASVLTSPLQRAVRTCVLAGFGSAAEVEPDLLEWNYGAYEGRTSADIRAERPDWQLFRDGCPGGESPDQIGARADRVVRRVRAIEGDALFFSSGHFLRVFAARWLGLDPGAGRYFLLGTARAQKSWRSAMEGLRRQYGCGPVELTGSAAALYERQNVLSWELRASTSLARLRHGQRRPRPARKLPSAVYRRFTEGFGTADLVSAKALLDTLRP